MSQRADRERYESAMAEYHAHLCSKGWMDQSKDALLKSQELLSKLDSARLQSLTGLRRFREEIEQVVAVDRAEDIKKSLEPEKETQV